MIHIKKDAQQPYLNAFCKATVGPKSNKITRAADELGRAINYFTNPQIYANNQKLSKKSFTFKVYKDKTLANKLGTIFGNKCAYCESRFAHVMPREIEHFRPKSEVQNIGAQTLRPGYYWLGADWSNLLVACIDCNRSRKHNVPGQAKSLKLGKGSQFPLSSEQHRVRHHTGIITSEEPYRLLINPCQDQPEELLTYDDDGLIYPKVANDLKAQASITVYALQRKGLVEERKRVLNELNSKIDSLRYLATDFIESLDKEPESKLDRKRQELERQMKSIRKMFEQDEPFLGMVRDYIRRHNASGSFADLQRANINLTDLLR